MNEYFSDEQIVVAMRELDSDGEWNTDEGDYTLDMALEDDNFTMENVELLADHLGVDNLEARVTCYNVDVSHGVSLDCIATMFNYDIYIEDCAVCRAEVFTGDGVVKERGTAVSVDGDVNGSQLDGYLCQGCYNTFNQTIMRLTV